MQGLLLQFESSFPMLIVSSLSTVNENRLEADDAGLYLGPLGLSAVYSTTSKRSYQLNTDSSRALLRPRLTVCISRTADNSQKKTLSSRSSSVGTWPAWTCFSERVCTVGPKKLRRLLKMLVFLIWYKLDSLLNYLSEKFNWKKNINLFEHLVCSIETAWRKPEDHVLQHELRTVWRASSVQARQFDLLYKRCPQMYKCHKFAYVISKLKIA